MSIVVRGNDVVLAASGNVFGVAPRIRETARRLVRCPSCMQPLEIELGFDLEEASGQPASLAVQMYDEGDDFMVLLREGSTLLVTRRHEDVTAPESRQCSGGVYVGTSLHAAYAKMWHWATLLTKGSKDLAKRRRALEREVEDAMAENRAAEVEFPEGVRRFFSREQLRGKRPVEPRDVVRAGELECVRGVEDGYGGRVYLVNRTAFLRDFRSPFAPEVLVAALGGEGELRGPELISPTCVAGLQVRPLERPTPASVPREAKESPDVEVVQDALFDVPSRQPESRTRAARARYGTKEAATQFDLLGATSTTG